VAPEFSLAGRRVDFALCHPPNKPVVFIEVKQMGGSTQAKLQLFEYAFHVGVPMAVLTTGQEWHIYLPGERGNYGERKVYGLDLLQRSPAESVGRLRRYLEFDAVCSGKAIEQARLDYQSVAKNREIQRTLPEALSRLVAEKDELLLELLAEKVEAICGFRPEPSVVASFLSQRIVSLAQPPMRPDRVSTVLSGTKTAKLRPLPQDRDGREERGFELYGEWHPARNGREVMIGILEAFQSRDSSFMERLAAHPKRSKKRRYVARSKGELFPGSPHLAEEPSHAKELGNHSGWWVDCNQSIGSMEQLIRMACEIAGQRYGVDIKAVFK
jgi:hypothetical protein